MIEKRKIIIICTILELLFSALVVYFMIPRAYIKFSAAPSQVNILIDNKDKHSIKDGDTIQISPGKHVVTIYKDEFNPYIKPITVKSGQTNDFIVALTALTDDAQKQLQDTRSITVAQKFSDMNMALQADMMRINNPISQYLPIQARLYQISACPSVKYPNNPLKIALCIDMTITDDTEANLRAYALTNIEDHGFDPNSFEIIWTVVPN